MTEPAAGGNLPAAAQTEFELLASLQIFGLPVQATATFGPGIDTILAARFGDVTLGEVLTYLVNKAEPSLNFKLTPPWDLLNAINLRNFEFEVDLTNFRVGFSYDDLDVNFPLVSLDRIEVWYSPATKSRNKSVDLSLFGSFLGIDFSSEPGLTWDVLSQPAPSVPGQGPKFFDLEYLGLGQHVTLRDTASLDTLKQVMDALEGTYASVDPHSNPLTTLTTLKFDASAGWLFGAKFSALDTVTLAAVFNDPVLYGLRLALQGSRAGNLAGLEFEILYRKVSDSLGVYHIELKLPDAVRKQEMGEANITLPIIDLDIYTNGDFLVDLGFPRNLDFSRAFQIDFIVWVGPIPLPVSAAAGFYFGVLSGQTATQVPQVSNGSFAPVIVAGFGFRVGIGYELSIGPVDAGFFAGFVGIVEGVLAWFHPDSGPDSTSVYLKVTGTVGIQIHIWGTVNFVVLQASLDIYAYATATVAIESYQPIQVAFDAGISISLSIKVLFFSITLSFSATIHESLTIGQASPAPWVLAPAPPAQATAPGPAPQQLSARGIVRSSGRVVQASPVFAQVLATGISWHDQAPAGTQAGLTLGVYLQPMLTACQPADRPDGGLTGPSPQLVATLFVADRGQLEGAIAVANQSLPLGKDIPLTKPDGTPLTAPDGSQVITKHDGSSTFQNLAGASPDAPDPFTLGFLIRDVPGLLPAGPITTPDETVTLDGGPCVVQDGDTLSSIATRLLSPFEQLTQEALRWAVESAHLSVQQAQAAPGGSATVPAATGPGAPVSASHLHALYLELTNPGTPFTLSQVVSFLTSRDITLDLRSMAAMDTAPDNPSFTVFPMPPFLTLTADGPATDFGAGSPYQATAAYQQYLTRYFAELSAPAPPPVVTPQPTAAPTASVAATLFADYFAFILRQLIQDALDLYRNYPYQAQKTDTLAGIASQFGISDPDLAALNLDVASLLVAGQTVTFADGATVTTQAGDTLGSLAGRSGHSTADLAAAIGAQPGLLQPGAVLSLVGGGTYVVAPGDTLLAIATSRQTAVTDQVAVTRIAEANKDSTAFFATGATLNINQGSTQVVGGETLRTLAARLQLTPLLVAQAIRRETGVLTIGTTIQISGGSYVVREGDTLGSIAAGLAAPLAAVAGQAATVTGLLIPLTRLTLPGGQVHTVGPTDTLASIAAATGAAVTDVATAAAGQLFAGVGFPLPPLAWTVTAASSTDPAAESLGAIAARFGTTLAAVVAGGNADALLLRTGAPVVFGLAIQVQPGDTLAALAGRFDADLAELAAVLGDQAGLLNPGTTVPAPPSAGYVIKHGDTLASIAAAYGTSADAITAANPQVNCQPGQPCWAPVPGASLPQPGMGISMPVGLRIILPPGSSYQVGSQDSLTGIARAFGLELTKLVPAIAAAPLTPQATVVLPPVSHTVADTDTPLSIAARFGLSVQQLVLANTGAGFGTVGVPDAEVVPLDVLTADLARSGSFDKPAGALARFMLHGLRLPRPADVAKASAEGADPAGLPLYPMYTLTGQQLTPPASPPAGYGLTLAASASSPGPQYLTFAGGAGPLTVPLSPADRATLASLGTQLGQASPIDLGVLAATRYPPYAVVPRQYALGKPVPWQAATQPPLRYDPAGTGPPPAPAPAAGQPTLLPFPDALRRQIAASAAAGRPGLWVDLSSASKASPTAATQTTPVDGFGWATKVDFGLRRAVDPNAPGQPLPYVYEVSGVDQDGPADLRQLLEYALGAGQADALTLALAYPLSAVSASGPGLRSDPVDPGSVLLVKANLSTRSSPPVAAAAAEARALAAPQDSAGATVTAATMSAADARHFLLLLWEATVTNTGGYYLYYRAGPDGPGLPADIFGTGPTATVSLLVTAFPQAGSSSTIPLRAFHNTALVTDNLPDPNAAVFAVPRQLPLATAAARLADLGLSLPALIAANVTTANLLAPGVQIKAGGTPRPVEPGDDILTVALDLGLDPGTVVQQIAADPNPLGYFNSNAYVELYPEWLTVQGTLQPGAAGFRLVRTNPDPLGPDDARPAAGTPQNPAPQDPKTQLAMLFNLAGYRLVANTGFQASADGLPAGPARSDSGPLNHELTAVDGAEPWIYSRQLRIDRFATSQPAAVLGRQQDPYAGVGFSARFGWQPQDVFGNRILPEQDIDVDVAYTDDLVALSQWPSVVTGYRFTRSAGAAEVQVSVALNTGAYVPAPGDVFTPVGPPGQAASPALDAAQPGTAPGIAAQAAAHRDRYAAIFWQLSHDLTAEVTTTVDEGASHPLDVAGLAAFASGAWGYLGTVAATTQLTATTASPPGTNATLAQIAAAYNVSPAELAQANRSAAQNYAAADLLTPGVPVIVPKWYTVVQNDTLAAIAQRSPVPADPAGLASANPGMTLQPGTLLAVGTLRTVTAGDTLASIAAAAGLDRTQLASANGRVTGLLNPGTAITPTYTVTVGDTLATVAGRLNLTLGEGAAAVDAAGTAPLTVGAQVVVPVPVTVTAGDTLAAVAARFGVSVAELGAANADADVLSPGAQIVLPDGTSVTVAAQATLNSIAAAAGLAADTQDPAGVLAGVAANAESSQLLRPGATLTSGYRVRAGDTLASVVATFAAPPGLGPEDIAAANAQVPGLLVPGQPVLLGHVSYPVQPGDTFASLATATGATVADLATANATATGLLAAKTTIAIPRHVVLAAGTAPDQAGPGTHQVAAGDTLASIAGTTRQVTALGSANSDVTGLLAAVPLSYTTPDGHTAAVTPAPNDTLSTVVWQMQGQLDAGVGAAQQVTVALLAEANQTVACLRPGAVMLVPPTDVTFGAAVTASNPETVFPLETSVTLRRTAHVDPGLAALANPALGAAGASDVDSALAALGACDVTSVTTPLAPALPEGAAGQTLALQQFALAFEAAFSAPQLKLATTGSGSSGTQTQQLFAVQYRTAALNYTINVPAAPCFFAPRPLSNALWRSPGPIPIRGYTRGQPLGPAQPTSFGGVDLDGWAQAFLAQLDLMLSSDYAVAAYALDPACYSGLVRAKQALAAAIRDSVDTVTLPGPDPQGPSLAAAKDALYQQLLITLSTAYQVDTIIQLPVTVTAPAAWTGDTAPRLRGQPSADTYTVPAGATLGSVAQYFLAPPDQLITELADYGYLLEPGFVVHGQDGQQPFTVTTGDTLGSLAERFSVVPAGALGVTLTDAAGHPLADAPGLLRPGAAVNLVRRTYPLASDDTLFSAISYLALNVATDAALAAAVDGFAAMNATLTGLFISGTTLQVPSPAPPASVTVQGEPTPDTIAGLAAGHGLTPLEVVTSIAARTDVLAADVAFTAGDQAITALPGQSLNEIAATAGLTLDELTPAVQDLQGLLVPGVTVTLAPAPLSHLVSGTDTLTTIAGALGVTPPWLVTTQLHVAQVLQAGTSVSYLSRVAGFSLSDADISLVNGQGALTFLFHTASNTSFSNLAVQLSYQVNQLQYGIEDVAWASGYQSSQWLTFLVPPPDQSIGTVDVPIPLRAYPVPPSVTGQQVVPFTVGRQGEPLTLPQLRRYNYDYAFSAQRAAQDTVHTSQSRNTVQADGTTTSVQQDGLPAALAQYATVRDDLEQDLALLSGVNPAAPVTIVTGSADTLTKLAQAAAVDAGYFGGVNAEVTGLFPDNTPLTVAGQPVTAGTGDTLDGIAAALGVDVGLVITAAAGVTLASGVALTRPQPGRQPVWQALRVFTDLAGQVAKAWAPWVAAETGPGTAPGPAPSAVVGAVPQYAARYQVRRGSLATGQATVHLLPDGDAAALHADDLVVGLGGHVPADGSGRAARQQVTYTPPDSAGPAVSADSSGGPVSGVDDFYLLVPDQDAVTTQNIWGEVSITRNASLLAGLATNPAFVYTVPEVKAIAPGVPLISWTDPFDLAGVPFAPPPAQPGPATGSTRPLADWLINFFDTLLNRYEVLGTDTLAKIALRYDLSLTDLAPAVAAVPGLLAAGARLPLPDGSIRQVTSSDTLASVAAATSVQVPDLVQAVAGTSGLLVPGTLIRPVAVARSLRVAVDYGFPLVTAGAGGTGAGGTGVAVAGPAAQTEIVSRLPVLLCPAFLFDSATDLQPGSGFCASLAQQLDAWAAKRGLPPGAGRWVLDVSLYTTLPGAAQAPPLLELTDIRLDRRLVAPDSGGSP